MIRTTRTRRGVTLVEMMVSAALCILGMWLLVWVYQQGLDGFRNGRANADLTAQERMVTALMTRDLRAAHFLPEDTKPNQGRRLSDQRPDLFTPKYTAPKSGYFWTRSSNTVVLGTVPDDPTTSPTIDTNGFTYTRSTGHFIQFTMTLPGGTNDQTFGAQVPAVTGPQVFGTAAEVSYFLVQTGSSANGQVPVFDLYRRQRLVARTTDDAPAYSAAAPFPDAPEVMVVDATKTPRQIQTLAGLGPTTPVSFRLVPFTTIPLTSARFGEDKLMSGVLSFEVKYTGPATSISTGTNSSTNWPTAFNFVSPQYPAGNTDYPYDFLPSQAGEFDTHGQPFKVAPSGAQSGTLLPLRITGAQIRIRAMDVPTLTTRQTTFTVDL